jgi:transketolase
MFLITIIRETKEKQVILIMLNQQQIIELNRFAIKIRIETIREIANLGKGHVGGTLSLAEVLAVLYGGVMKIDPTNPGWEERDWLVVSKGHAGPAIYAVLALKGYFSMEELNTLNLPGTNLPSHCDRNKTPGIDMTTGSLGQGASSAMGIALGNQIDGRDNYTYLILGDGECQEGQVWEAALFANQYKLSHLIAFIDYNQQQLDGYTWDVCDLGDLTQKFVDFGWFAQSVDGHDVVHIYEAIEKAKQQNEKPSMIVLNTVKGKGCGFAEGKLNNHHMTITKEQMEEAIKELRTVLESFS